MGLVVQSRRSDAQCNLDVERGGSLGRNVRAGRC